MTRIFVWPSKFKKHKALKKDNKELMPTPWLPKRWWDFCMSERERKKKQFFLSNGFCVHQ